MNSPKSSPSDAPASIPVPARIRELLMRLVAGQTPAAVVPGAIKSLRLNEVDFNDMAPQVEVADDRLVVTLKGYMSIRAFGSCCHFPMGGSLDVGGS